MEDMYFKDIKGKFRIYPGYAYAFSSDGKVVNLRTQKERKPQYNSRNGYQMIIMMADGQYKGKYVHRCVAELFVDNPNGYNYVGHLDGDKQNNAASNLYWMSDEEFKAKRKKG